MDLIVQPHHYSAKYPENRRHGHPYNITLKILAHHLAQSLNAKASQGTQLNKLKGF